MLFVGIDAGGSKCETMICDRDAQILGYGIAYGTELNKNVKTTYCDRKNGSGRSFECIKLSFERAFGNLSKAEELFITFNNDSGLLKNYLDEQKINYKEIYISDEANGIAKSVNIERCYIASAGTGAFAYYMNTENRFYFEGMGPNLGDYGSGFRIGHKAVRAVSVNEWGEEFKTSLALIINKKILGKETNSYGQDLVNIFFDLPERNYVAALAEPVVQEAEKGDRIAKEILIEEAKLFGRTVCVLVKNVRPCKEKLPIICSGSIFKSNIYKETFVQYVKEKIDNPIIFCSFSLVYGYIMNSVLGENSLDKNEYYEKLKNNAGKFRFQ